MKRKITLTIGVILVIAGISLLFYRLYYSGEVTSLTKKGEDIISEYDSEVQDQDSSVSNSKPEKSLVEKLQEAFSNQDVIGYIYYPEASISYPIVQGSDNEEYLRKNINGDYSPNGSIFLDSSSNSNFTDVGSVIYGHHMRNGDMFGRLESSYSLGDTFVIYTRTSKLSYRVVSREVLNPEDTIAILCRGNDTSASDFKERLSKYTDEYSFGEDKGKYVTLVTCHYEGGNTIRCGVTGALIKEEI